MRSKTDDIPLATLVDVIAVATRAIEAGAKPAASVSEYLKQTEQGAYRAQAMELVGSKSFNAI
jgi:hypothetical protein